MSLKDTSQNHRCNQQLIYLLPKFIPTKPISSLFNDDDETPLRLTEIMAVPLIGSKSPIKKFQFSRNQNLKANQQLESKRNLAYNVAKKNKRDDNDKKVIKLNQKTSYGISFY